MNNYLAGLEAESIEIIRETVALAERPVMMYSIGKDSSVMLHLARKAFWPAPPPFPLLHVDTTWKFREMIEFRDRIAAESGIKMIVHINHRRKAEGVNPFTCDPDTYTGLMKTEALKQALDAGRFDLIMGGARRDEEKSRAKERVFSFRSQGHRWDPRLQRPELWNLYNARIHPGESIRVFPLSNWTEVDIWQYIAQENIEVVKLYFSAPRPVVCRSGQLIMVDDDRLPLHPGETPQIRMVRFRTLGCYPLTAAIESTAETVAEILQEMQCARNSEHQGRLIDHDQAPSLEKLRYLEEVKVTSGDPQTNFRMPVQLVHRPTQDFRGYCGRIASGEVRVGDSVCVVPGLRRTKVRSIVAGQAELPSASAGDSVTLCLDDEVDVSRGNVLAAASDPIEMSDQFEARIICLSDHHLVAGRSYLLYLHTCQAVATITAMKYQIDVLTGSHLAARALSMNDIGVVNLSTDRPVPLEPYARCRRLGAFILIDRFSNETVGAGMIDFSLRRAANIHWQAVDIGKQTRARQKLQKPVCLWFTGLSGAGKSTIANLLEKRLFLAGRHTYLLDGDNVRHGLNRDLGFTEPDRVENIRRVTEVARLFVDAGIVTIVSFISPYREERAIARSRFEPGEFIEVFVDAPLDVCESRDPKGLYAKARRGELANFTGIDSVYEPPAEPEIRLDTTSETPEQCVDRILSFIEQRAHLLAGESRA